MAAEVIDGKAFAAKMKEQIALDAKALEEKGRKPHLLALQVGENAASRSYIASQKQGCEELGITYTLDEMPEESTMGDIKARVDEINADDSIDGVIVQMPLPAGLDHQEIVECLAPEKDIEGLSAANLGRLFQSGVGPAPCTAAAAMELLLSTGITPKGKEAVIVGRGDVVGKPLIALLLWQHATVTVCHSRSDLEPQIKRADILMTCTGATQLFWQRYKKALKKFEAGEGDKPELPNLDPLIPAEWIKPGAVVIDIAVNRVPKGFDEEGKPLKNDKGKLALVTKGDVDFDGALEVASAISPARGGVGPVTTAILLRNVIDAAKRRMEK